MARRRSSRTEDTPIAFDALTIEGGLLAAPWLARVAQLEAGTQAEADYGVLPGLALRDEIGRYWRIAQAHWSRFKVGRAAKAEPVALADRFVTDLLRDAFGFTTLAPSAPITMSERTFPIRAFGVGRRVPVAVAPAGAGLDTALPELGDDGRRRSAFGLVQEYLNADDDALWGLCSDGLRLRLARDNASLTRPAWLEADLQRIFDEALYPDFAALWLLVHASRFGAPDQPVDACPLEAWREAGREEGTRAREKLRDGVEDALLALGQGFLIHPANTALRAALHGGTLSTRQYYGQILRLVYRLIFLITVEERGLLHPRRTPKDLRALYAEGYGLMRLRERSLRRAAHDRHTDLWAGLGITFRALASGEPRLGLPALGGIFAADQCPDLDEARLENRALLLALYRLCWLQEPTGLARVNWRDMGSDELGYVYEGLLELTPRISKDGRDFTFLERSEGRGHARKTTGSYYTPDSLVEILLESALEPVVQRALAARPGDPARAILDLAVVDPACGSGHFLLFAARRLAEHLARALAEGTPSADDYRRALRQVVARCIYGVDLNPMAVELCKVSLWLEAVDPGLPLTFLKAHIRQGNALLGTNRALMGDAVPDDAWVALEGDDRKVVRSLKARNRDELTGQRRLPWGTRDETGDLVGAMQAVEAAPDTDLATIAAKARRWEEYLASPAYKHQKLVADAWCTAFIWPKAEAGPVVEAAPTTAAWRALRDGEGRPRLLMVETVEELAREYDLFHWELAFPQVFARGGFDIVLGNPPWEKLKLAELEFFASRNKAIASTNNAAQRKKRIRALQSLDPVLWEEWTAASREAQGTSHFVRKSGRYRLCGKGDVNTYALFAEHNWQALGPHGRAGFIVPSGIATDNTTKEYFQAITRHRSLVAMWEFENEGFFTAGKGHMLRFALTTLVGRGAPAERADFMFQGLAVTDLDDPERHFNLSAEDIETINPNTGTCPIFRTRRDASIALTLYRRAGVLWNEGAPDGNPWGLRFMAMFHMTNDSAHFRTRGELSAASWSLQGNRFVKGDQAMLPLFEAKMVYTYNHRSGSFEGAAPGERPHRLPTPSDQQLADPGYLVQPFYWVADEEVEKRLDSVWDRGWLLGWRDITDARASVRTTIACLLPRCAVNNKIPLFIPSVEPATIAAFCANLNSIPLDYAARQKIGGITLNYFIMKQFPVLPPSTFTKPSAWHGGMTLKAWLLPRVLELTYTAWDLQPFAQDCGDEGPPFIWAPDRRFQLQCEIDAAFFHLYGVARDDVDYILDTFPVLRRADERVYDEYRTKRVVLEIYDALAHASATGQPYVSPLPPPRRAE